MKKRDVMKRRDDDDALAWELACLAAIPMLVMAVFWLIAFALMWFPEFGTKQGRLHYADALQTMGGGHDSIVVRGLRLSAAGVPLRESGKDGKQ